MSYQPLADKIRPRELDEMVGQQHIIGENGVLRRILENGSVPNLIFYGPSGTGKTTLAQIIAGKTHRQLVKLNATTASTADIRAVTGQLDTLLAPEGVLLYLDEIQYFNKKQQQSLLEFIENGKITLIASTTENPYFYVYNAILSRSTIFEFKPIQIADTEKAVERAFRLWGQEQGRAVEPEPGVDLSFRGLRRRYPQGRQRGGAFVCRRGKGWPREGHAGRRPCHCPEICQPL